MEKKWKRLSPEEQERHYNYRKFDTLLHTIKRMEGYVDSMVVLFRSKYTEEELLDTLDVYKGDSPLLFLQQRKDSQFRDFILATSLVECRCAHSCAVVRSHHPFTRKEGTDYKWLYHSLEEYLTEIYNKGEDFVLYLTSTNDLLLKREDEFEYLAPINSSGEMLIRSMTHFPLRRNPRFQQYYMLYTVLSNRELYGNAKMFTDVRYDKTVPPELYSHPSLRRQRPSRNKGRKE